ncbi:MAG: hypothetical protein LBO81_07740 [Clostridiales Family XIII bacterium]|jgi:hypothetical protein|nr:hypothetical protein [Clostridiales Family XIII bacterium]
MAWESVVAIFAVFGEPIVFVGIFLDNSSVYSIVILSLIVLFMFGYTFVKHRNMKKAEDAIDTLLDSCAGTKSKWPRKEVISADQLERLKKDLAGQKVYLAQATVNRMVEDRLASKMAAQFEISFREANPDLPKDPGAYEWAKAYVRTFRKKDDYLPLLRATMRKHGIKLKMFRLREIVQNEIDAGKAVRKTMKRLDR